MSNVHSPQSALYIPQTPEPPTLNTNFSNALPDFAFDSTLPTPDSTLPTPNSPLATPDPQTPTPGPEPPDSRPRHAGGRPRRLDDVKRGQICAILSVGCSIEVAAHYVGCSASTVRREIERDPKFDQEVREAFLAAELKPLHALRQAAQTHWRAAAWFLERTIPRRFAKRDPRAVTPDQLFTLTEVMGDILAKEIKDPDLSRRIVERLTKLGKNAERAALSAQIRPQLKRKKRRTRDVNPPVLPEWLDGPEELQDDQPST